MVDFRPKTGRRSPWGVTRPLTRPGAYIATRPRNSINNRSNPSTPTWGRGRENRHRNHTSSAAVLGPPALGVGRSVVRRQNPSVNGQPVGSCQARTASRHTSRYAGPESTARTSDTELSRGVMHPAREHSMSMTAQFHLSVGYLASRLVLGWSPDDLPLVVSRRGWLPHCSVGPRALVGRRRLGEEDGVADSSRPIANAPVSRASLGKVHGPYLPQGRSTATPRPWSASADADVKQMAILPLNIGMPRPPAERGRQRRAHPVARWRMPTVTRVASALCRQLHPRARRFGLRPRHRAASAAIVSAC